jgi:hypothetical protein
MDSGFDARELRRRQIGKAERIWLDFTTRERGFFVDGDELSGVSKRLLTRYEAIKDGYIEGGTGATFEDVHEAFSDYAKSTRRNFFVNQLGGEVFEAGNRTAQEVIHLKFRNGQLNRTIRKIVTPQIEAQPDQLDRMKLYFGVDADNYAARRITEKR